MNKIRVSLTTNQSPVVLSWNLQTGISGNGIAICTLNRLEWQIMKITQKLIPSYNSNCTRTTSVSTLVWSRPQFTNLSYPKRGSLIYEPYLFPAQMSTYVRMCGCAYSKSLWTSPILLTLGTSICILPDSCGWTGWVLSCGVKPFYFFS